MASPRLEAWDLRSDYLLFHEASLASKDVDPVYPVLRAVIEANGFGAGSEHGLWATVCHLTWYHLGSALAMWDRVLDAPMRIAKIPTLPCATERRGNRDPRQLEANLTGWWQAARNAGSLEAFLTEGLPPSAELAWAEVMRRIESIHGNGRWASYKMAEMLAKVNDLPLKPYHMGHANSSGPRQGLGLLIADLPTGNSAEDVEALDELSEVFVEGMRLRGLSARIEEVETTLCDFHSLWAGRYYVGNDIDQMLEQIMAVPSPQQDNVLQARYDTLPHAYLGELNGWNRVDRERQKVYRATGEILVR